MKVTYTKILGRRILLLFLVFTLIFSIAGLFVRKKIIDRLDNISKLAISVEQNQSKPEHVLLLLNQANNDFQESLLDIKSNKILDYKIKLAKAFNEIDTLLKLNEETPALYLLPNRITG